MVCSPIKALRELGSERRKTVKLYDIYSSRAVSFKRFDSRLLNTIKRGSVRGRTLYQMGNRGKSGCMLERLEYLVVPHDHKSKGNKPSSGVYQQERL